MHSRRGFAWDALGIVDEEIDRHRLREALPAWVPEIHYLPECGSTNEVAARWASRGAPHGSLVLADYQSAGRGRLDRRWVAPPGSSLLFSFVLRPSFLVEQWGLVGLAAGVAICRQLRELEIEASLKWPNDILIGDKKVAGVLAESHRGAVVLGVGINVNVGEFPPDLQDTAASMSQEAGRRFERLQVLRGCVEKFAGVYDRLPDGLIESYRPLCGTLGARVKVECAGESVEDVAEDVDGTGALVLSGGKVIGAGDVVHLRT
ncbi:MAG: biotin--[acetyl-CoA-carboxylase] ligase [Actinomycetota bacterium]